MSKTEKNLTKDPKTTTSRERLARRIVEHYPDRIFECEDDVYDALDEYATFLSDHYEKMLGDHNRLTGLMYSNPRVGAFITDVADGEDALVACVRYFGKELLEGSYKLDCDVDIYLLTDMKAIYNVGSGHLIHDNNGFKLTGCDGEIDYTQPPELSYSLYSDYYWYEIGDMVCIGNGKVLYYCFPKDKSVSVAKVRLAAEELYKIVMEK